MTAEDFELQPRGPYLFNYWQARQQVETPFGSFVVEAHMPLEDTAPPDPAMVRQANELAEFTRSNPEAILEKIYEHYRAMADHWLEMCRVPRALRQDELSPYLEVLTLNVNRDGDEPTIYVSPRWDVEHAISMAVREGRVEFQDL
jgi:hypothetical protein